MISSWGATGGLKPAMSLNLLSGAISSLVSFTRATPATVTDFEGLIKTVKSGEVRFDGMRRVENLLMYSQDFSNAVWSKVGSTIGALVTAPDGSNTALALTEAAANSRHFVYQGYSVTATNTYSMSIYLKAGTRQYAALGLKNNSSTLLYAVNIDLLTGVVTNTTSTGSPTGIFLGIVSVGNGWYKCSISLTSIVGDIGFYFSVSTSNSNTPSWVQEVPSYLGDGTSGIYIWGAQLENVTGQTNQNPSEYISTNVLSYPYQGAGVDGVQYFPYTNPNCIINGAITTVPTVSINSSNSKFAYGCATAGDYFSTPSSTANRITGNLSLLVQVSMDTWTPATTTQCLVVKDGVSAGTRSWAFTVPTTGVLRLNASFDGSTITSYDSTVATGFANGTVHYVGVQRESSTGIIRFYTSDDEVRFVRANQGILTHVQLGLMFGIHKNTVHKIWRNERYKDVQ